MNPKESTDGGQNNATWGDNTRTNGTNDSNSTQFDNSNENSNSPTGGSDDYSPTHSEKTWLIVAVGVGALLASVPLTHYMNKFGPRILFAAAGFLSAIATALIPTAARLGLPYFLVVRAFQGVGYAACMPMVGGVTAKWATLKQHAIFVSVLTLFMQIAPTISMPISGELCESSFGWTSVYYVHAVYSFILFTLFALFYRNSPKNHPCVGETELDELADGKSDSEVTDETHENVPYGSIFKTMAIWAVWVASIGNFCSYNLITLFSPTYLHKVMGYPVVKTGLSAALPPICQMLMKITAGATSDKISHCSEKVKVRVYNSVAFFGFALFICLLALTPQSHPTLALVLLTAATTLLGINTGGYYKSATLVSRRYSQAVMGIDSTVICTTMLIVPLIVEVITDTDTVGEWAIVFFIIAGIMIVTNLFFVVFARASPASWAKEEDSSSND
uniref:Major facilitator superfamily (MFS) profile domain-containing protein n=1 Tax=Plectus sambesii TaxID=2011161 RepID=A0A914VML1_9BILA